MIVDGAFFARLPLASRFILVRHGESEGNAAGVFQGRRDYALSPRGRQQAEALGRSLREHPGAATLCSPLSRARETAEIAARTAGFAAPIVSDVLTELETGSFTGRSWHELREGGTDEWRSFRTRSWEGVAGAEREADLYDRAVAAWETLRSAAEKQAREDPGSRPCVVAVTHGGFLQWLVKATFGARAWFPILPIENCCIYRLRTEPVGPEHAAVFWETMDKRIEA